MIDYRVGVFQGARDNIPGTTAEPANPGHDLRFTGMVMVNLQDAQPGWFYNANSLGTLNVLSFGAGYDRMNRSDFDDHKAWSIFAVAEQRVGPGHLSANAAYYDWEGIIGGFGDGNSAQVTLAYLIDGTDLQPVLRWQQQDPDDDKKLDTVGIGAAYYLKGDNINIKAEYSIDDRISADGKKKDAFRIQAQLFF